MHVSWFGFLVLCTAAASSVRAALPDDPAFTDTLTTEQRVASGLSLLTEGERTALDAAVRKEITLATQGDVYGFASTFTARRSPSERSALGLDRLSSEEKARLDEQVAEAIANRPRTVLAAQPLRSAEGVTSHTPGPVTHGAVTVAYVWNSHGGSGFGAAVDVVQTWPSGRSLALSVSDFRGKGFFSPSNAGVSRCSHR